MKNLHEPDDTAQRSQALIRTLKLSSAGTGPCPSCGQETERFVKPPASSRDTKPRCLDCWKAEWWLQRDDRNQHRAGYDPACSASRQDQPLCHVSQKTEPEGP